MTFQMLQNTNYSPHLRNRFTIDVRLMNNCELSTILDFCVQIKFFSASCRTSQGTNPFSLIKSHRCEKYMFVDLHI